MVSSAPVIHPAVMVAIHILKTDLPVLRPGALVSDRFPETDPDELVKVGRAGGIKANMVTDNPLLIFECWQKRSLAPNAEVFSTDVLMVLEGSQFKTYTYGTSAEQVFVRWWNPVGLAEFDDPDKPNLSRWQITGELGLATKR